MTDLLVGVDVGTTNLKVGIFTATAEVVAAAARPCPLAYGPDGRIEVDPESWWRGFVESFEECLREVERSAVRAIAVSSQAQTYVSIGEHGQATGPAPSWLAATGDDRDVAEALRGHDFYAHTGWPRPNPLLAVSKLRRRPASGRILFADGYLMHRLTGECAVSRNLAAMSGLYSMVEGGWWPPALAAAHVAVEALPALREIGGVVGNLDPGLARRWGIPPVPVVAGANDQTAAALGAGLAAPGQAAIGHGTALVTYHVVASDEPPPPCRPLRGPYVGGLRYELLACNNGGAMMEWAKGVLAPARSWDEFFAGAFSVPAGCGGLRFRPEADGGPGGASFRGLGPAHGADHLARAVLEGLACAARAQLDALAVSGTVRLTGGGSRNDSYVQLLADVTGREVERLDQPHAGLWGTALAAGHGAGVFPDLLSAARSCRRPGQVMRPRPNDAEVYGRVYDDYLAETMSPRPARGSAGGIT